MSTPHQLQQDYAAGSPVDAGAASPLPVQPPQSVDQEIEDYEQKIRILRHDNSLHAQQIERLEGNLSTLYEGAEMEEENFTNVVLRRLRDIRGDKERLNAHLRLQEGRRAKEEAKLAAIQSQRVTLSKSLKAEEVNIQSRLQHQIELVKQQRQRLENKVHSEVLSSEDLQRELYQFRALLDAKHSHTIINLDGYPPTSDTIPSPTSGGEGTNSVLARTDDEGETMGGGEMRSTSMLQASMSSGPTTPFGGGDATMANLLQSEITRVRALQRETQERTVRAQRKREELEEQLFNFMARRGGGRAVAASSTPFLLSHPPQQHSDPFATPGRNEACLLSSTSRNFSIGALDTGSYAQGGGGGGGCGNSSNASVVATPRSGTQGGGYVSRSQSLWSTTHSQAAAGGGGQASSSYRHYSTCNTPIQGQQSNYSHNPITHVGGGGGSLAPSANSSFQGVRAMRSSSMVGMGGGGNTGGGGGCDAVLNLLRLSQQHHQQQGLSGGAAFGSSLPKDLGVAASPGSISQHLNPLNSAHCGSPSAVPRLFGGAPHNGVGTAGIGADLTGRVRSESTTSSVHRYNPNNSSSSQLPSDVFLVSPHRTSAVPVAHYVGGGGASDRRSHSQSRGVADSASNAAPSNTAGPHTTTTTTSTRQTPLRTSEPIRTHTPAPLHQIGGSTSSSSQQQCLPPPQPFSTTHNSFSVTLANSAIPLQSTPRGTNINQPSVVPLTNVNTSTAVSLRNSIHSIGGDTGRSSVTTGGRGGRHSPSVGGSFHYSNSAAAMYPSYLGGNGGGNTSYHGNTFGGSSPASVTTRRSSCSAVVRPATHLLSEFKEQQERLQLDFGRPSISSARALSVGSDLGGLGAQGGGGTDGCGSASSVSSPLYRDTPPVVCGTNEESGLRSFPGTEERVTSTDLADPVNAQRGMDDSTPISPLASNNNLFQHHSSYSRRFSGDTTTGADSAVLGLDEVALANEAASSVSVGIEESILSMGATSKHH